ncbi:glyoxylase-like metal-dependent hydrolase (beta-lactamase superfamily II) [Brevibacterium sanguinis]|uniref:Glyoxylase-like metal-dependent hydrolase (Beta-lactamase superfamily II) n=2 Tax=Brevibacterium TaxID=1696 RepID=A0A366IGY9_9MICO|nr:MULTISPECIES: MBL fold metallo-hydrolase [Brevibacterium]RBP61565.1 glyoxylase-like metal-dependent hydrolase (beta-lactamase superfamily II) [Brevibacterium sanguinis]RBP70817.1 glyoxylase-like metal-dependent hydrolase (beta-lactamase superfamily II) [Brevibacterium celere]
MDVFVTQAQFLDVNCYAVRAEGSSRCLLIDAGADCAPGLARIAEEERLEPAAVFLTHGHPDHILGLPDVLAHWDVPVHLGAPDLYRLDSPAETLSPQFAPLLEPLVRDWAAPAVEGLVDGQVVTVAGLTVTAVAAPGHTEGSMLLRVRDGDEEVIFTGDVVFAGAMGRVDLPGGDAEAMADTLRSFTTLPDVPIYPGHGPGSRVGHEIATNPFL